MIVNYNCLLITYKHFDFYINKSRENTIYFNHSVQIFKIKSSYPVTHFSYLCIYPFIYRFHSFYLGNCDKIYLEKIRPILPEDDLKVLSSIPLTYYN